jgi:ligand-binding SRPBCC domain-containing protein
VNPATSELVWQFHGNPPRAFFSSFRGAAQRFANGNTLITDSANGRAFEINAEGELVWEFHTEVDEQKTRANKSGKVIRDSVYTVWRITDPLATTLRERASR